jgi:hypothetical protein
MTKTLHLTLYRRWFLEILKGTKTTEYRKMTPYWKKRLFDENGKTIKYDEIFFRNGYAKDCPKMRVKFLSLGVENGRYAIKLGRVVETKDIEVLKAGT